MANNRNRKAENEMKEKEMKNKGGSLTQLANLTNIWWTNKWTKFKASERDDRGGGGGGSRAREAGAEQSACYWEGAGEGSPQGREADLRKSCQPSRVSRDGLLEIVPVAGRPGTSPVRAQARAHRRKLRQSPRPGAAGAHL